LGKRHGHLSLPSAMRGAQLRDALGRRGITRVVVPN
jgi:hypothetical protein